MPEYDVPEGYTAVTYLNHLCEEGLKRRYPNITKELRERLDYELKTIENMGYVDYFLIVWDFIHYAKEHGIAVDLVVVPQPEVSFLTVWRSQISIRSGINCCLNVS